MINESFEYIEKQFNLNESDIESMTIEKSLKKDSRITLEDESEINQVISIFKGLKISEYKKKEGSYEEDFKYSLIITINYNNSDGSLFIKILNSKYVIIHHNIYKIENGDKLKELFEFFKTYDD